MQHAPLDDIENMFFLQKPIDAPMENYRRLLPKAAISVVCAPLRQNLEKIRRKFGPQIRPSQGVCYLFLTPFVAAVPF